MKKSNLRKRILMEFESLISQSCNNPRKTKKYRQLHVALLKKYYNAANVSIDYHRHRIKMDIIMDDTTYKAGKININLPVLHTDLIFNNLKTFLRSCIEKDDKSLGFYAQLLNTVTNQKRRHILVQ
ncbi:hypothetical protein J8L85_04585 [Maribacter sp. MMG018]|uniref:hypothetical protein n=1 Tax=Maribacter sp. MMG018 TaxID=2822688 RepID=UPI001B39146E|nr:hypothetical protein [Maribacter sp. MMG018]MBQ4913701.1 hypothetical protein [Maribacter sp. MMG018]